MPATPTDAERYAHWMRQYLAAQHALDWMTGASIRPVARLVYETYLGPGPDQRWVELELRAIFELAKLKKQPVRER